MTRPKLIPLIMALALLLTGCGMGGSIYANYRALDKLRLAETLGVDSAGTGVAVSAAAGKVGEDPGPLLLRRSGKSILEAMDALQDYSDRGRLFFSHVNYVLLGRAYAEGGVAELLDFAERDVGMRLDTELFLLQNSGAGDLILASGDEDFDVTELLESARRDLEKRAAGQVYSFRETAVALSEYGAALVCMLRVTDSSGSASPGGTTAVPAGYGILKDGRLAGELTGEEAEAVTLLLGGAGTAARTFPDGQGGAVTLQFDGTGGGVTVEWDETSAPKVKLSLRVRAVLAEADTARTELLETLEPLGDALAAALETDLRAAMEKSRALGADFLALAGALRRAGGDRFDRLPVDWLAALDYDVSVEAGIDHSSDLYDPVRVDGKGSGEA